MGHHNLHFGNDRYALHGAWSPPTSTANFCEEDYVISFYIAEFINSLTNVAYVYFALRYMYGPGSRGLFAPKVDSMSLSLLVLGICSFLFHASLRHALQFADELGMIFLGWAYMQVSFTARQPPARARLITAALTLVLTAFSAFYIWSTKIIYHVIACHTILVATSVRTQYLFHWAQPYFPRDKSRDWTVRSVKGLLVSAFGYFLWNVDLELCARLREYRAEIGLPWAWLLELHGWWHILTAIGAEMFVRVLREMRAELEREEARGLEGDKDK